MISKLEAVCLYLESLKGHRLKIEEIITHSPDKSYNRHLCTRSTVILTLDSFGIAISGGRMFFYDKGPTSYELCIDFLCEVTQDSERVILQEKFSDRIHRITEVTLYEAPDPLD